MEPVTHLLTGACLARSGFNRRTAYATLAMTLAAEAPDLDTLWSLRGPVAGFEHHRGWTHSFLGIPLEAAVVVGAVWLWHRWKLGRERARSKVYATRPETSPTPQPEAQAAPATPATSRAREAPPVRWALLYAFAIVALLSHILLDWTNNYGVRPFFPFNPRWYAGSFVFIFEPVMFLLLLAGLVAPALFGLVGGEVGARRERFRGRGWAVFALVSIALLWGWRGWEKLSAERIALGGDFGGVEITRTFLSPYPVTPFTWHAVIETPDFFQLATVDTWTGRVATTGQEDVFHKPASTPAALAAKRSWLGHVYLDWSQFPVVTDSGPDPDGISEVSFRDLRFLYDTLGMHGREASPLTGTAFVDGNRQVVRMVMNGRVQK